VRWIQLVAISLLRILKEIEVLKRREAEVRLERCDVELRTGEQEACC